MQEHFAAPGRRDDLPELPAELWRNIGQCLPMENLVAQADTTFYGQFRGGVSVTTQAELDAALQLAGARCIVVEAEGLTIAQAPVNNAPIIALSKVHATAGIIHARGNIHITASGTARVRAEGQVQVTADDETTVHARGQAQVTAHDKARVYAYMQAQITARNETTVYTRGQAQVTAHDEARIYAYEQVHVTAYNETSVHAFEQVQVTAHDETIVHARGQAQVTAYSETTVYARERAQVMRQNQAHFAASASETAPAGLV